MTETTGIPEQAEHGAIKDNVVYQSLVTGTFKPFRTPARSGQLNKFGNVREQVVIQRQ